MVDFQPEQNEHIIRRTKEAWRFDGDEEQELQSLVLTNKHLISVYEKSSVLFFKEKTVVDKKPLALISIIDDILQVKNVVDDNFGESLQILYDNGVEELYFLGNVPKSEYQQWESAIKKAVIENKKTIIKNDEIADAPLPSKENKQVAPIMINKEKVQEKNDMTVFCKECGAKNNADAKFCQNCGTLLNTNDKVVKNNPEYISCRKCGTENSANAKFCKNCGILLEDEKKVKQPEKSEQRREQDQQSSYSERKQEYAGKIIKCPNCGEILEAFHSVCPSCGYEIRGAVNSMAVQKFAVKLESESSRQGKITIIRNFPIPNTKEDVFEFLILAASNIGNNIDNGISDAWQSKVEQAYHKAKLIIKNKDELAYIQDTYNQVMDNLAKNRKIKSIKRADSLMSDIITFLPQIIIVVGWLMSIFAILPFCKINLDNVGTNGYQLVLLLDMIAGAFCIPFVCKCEYSLPKTITSIGLILSIIILIPLCNKNLDNVGSNAFQLILIVDIICSAVIFKKIFIHKRKEKNKQTSLNSISGVIILICVFLFLLVYGISSFFASISTSNDYSVEDMSSISDSCKEEYEEPNGLQVYAKTMTRKIGGAL